MESSRRVIVVLAIAILALSILPCAASEKPQKDEPNIWIEEGPMGPERPRGPREHRGPRERRGPGQRWFALTDEEIESIMKSLKESDPEKAKELEKLRSEDPNRFQFELGKHGGEQFSRIVRGRIERWREQRRDEFLEWLEKNYSQDAKELEGLKEKDAKLYLEKFEIISRKYWHIFEEERRNPELADVLKEDLELRKKTEEIIGKIKDTKDENEKKKLTTQLEEVIGDRFDLIIRRKQIEYARLLKRVEELQKQLEQSKEELTEWRDEKFKNANVKSRVNELLGERSFKWD